MNNETLLREIENCINQCDIVRLSKNVELLLNTTSLDAACKELANLLFNSYTSFKAAATAKMMEVILRVSPSIGLEEFPDNYFFRLAVIRGSFDLYECYREEIVDPFLSNKAKDEIIECFIDLAVIADGYDQTILQNYNRIQKGLHFNGAFGEYENNENVVLINREDFDIMDDVVEKYNAIVGRRDIIRDLNKRQELE